MVTEWLDLQTRLYGLQPDLFDRPGKGKKARGPTTELSGDPTIARLQRKTAKIERDVLFEAQEAEFMWRSKLNELRKDATFIQRPTEPRKKIQPPVDTAKESGEATTDGDSLDADDDAAGLLGGMFEADPNDESILGLPPPVIETKFTIRDFGKTSGLSPRRVLEESCRARDSACKVVFQDISTSSHQCRKALEVRWSKPQETPFPLAVESVTHKSNSMVTFISMDTLVTPDAQQAEGYVSTLALFILFTVSSKEGKAYLRIPAIWRDLWTEFSNMKKKQEDDIDKATVKNLKRLVDENQTTIEDDVVLLDNFRKRNGTASKPGSPLKGSARGDYFGQIEQLQDIWLAKAATPAFQRMMQGRMTLPVWNFREDILSTLETHQALIICSETGSGKSTQIPSYILEHEMLNGRHCKVYVTEPRRISAISLARRVSEELGENKNDVGTNRSLIGFAVRLESKVSSATRLVYAYVSLVSFIFFSLFVC